MGMEFRTDAIVIGAGVIGLAVARSLAHSGLQTLVIERGPQIGLETSSRNSGVIHAGIHYPAGSLKATTCLRGKALLYDFLEAYALPYRRCGKLIVAAGSGQHEALRALRSRALNCGLNDLQLIDAPALRELEPEVEGSLALFSPSTGILDPHQFMLALQGDLERAGGTVSLSTPVSGGRLAVGGWHRLEAGGEQPAVIGCRLLINATGLHARETWQRLVPAAQQGCAPPQFYAKGQYYRYRGKSPFARPVYPLPEPGGLGIHATPGMDGVLRFGPDVEWVDSLDYRVDERRREAFIAAIKAYYPGLDGGRLEPDYAGIRPKISGPGEVAADFAILTETEHGIARFCSLHGIESPGLTASLAIAERVAAALLRAPRV